MPAGQIIFSQIGEQEVEVRRAHSVALTVSSCGDGACTGFGIFTVTQGLRSDDDNAVNAKAAMTAAQTITTELLQNFYYRTLFENDDIPLVNDTLQNALNLASQRIQSQNTGGHSSAITLVINDNRLYLMRVGAGCAFLITKDGIQRLTSENSAQHNGAGLIGSAATLQPEDVTIKYLPSYSSLFISNADVWDTTEILNAILHAPSLGKAGAILLEQAPENIRADIAGVLIRVGLVQE